LQLIQQDDAAVERLLTSYEMMLGFYGIELVDRQTGEVRRADNWQQRFDNLNRLILSAVRTCFMLINTDKQCAGYLRQEVLWFGKFVGWFMYSFIHWFTCGTL